MVLVQGWGESFLHITHKNIVCLSVCIWCSVFSNGNSGVLVFAVLYSYITEFHPIIAEF